MSARPRSLAVKHRESARRFAAIGDETRLSIVRELADGQSRSISELTQKTSITRQAMTKHLHVLEDVGIVRGVRSGRENLFELNPKSINEMRSYLEFVSEQWDQALQRLKSFVE
jgi:DNA-binding transcriptional ArsR family regulator